MNSHGRVVSYETDTNGELVRCDDDKSQEHERARNGRRSCRPDDNDDNKHYDTTTTRAQPRQISRQAQQHAIVVVHVVVIVLPMLMQSPETRTDRTVHIHTLTHRTIYTANECGMRIGQRLALGSKAPTLRNGRCVLLFCVAPVGH